MPFPVGDVPAVGSSPEYLTYAGGCQRGLGEAPDPRGDLFAWGTRGCAEGDYGDRSTDYGARSEPVRGHVGKGLCRGHRPPTNIPVPGPPLPPPLVGLALRANLAASGRDSTTCCPISRALPAGRGATASRPFAAQRPSPCHPSVLRNLISRLHLHTGRRPICTFAPFSRFPVPGPPFHSAFR